MGSMKASPQPRQLAQEAAREAVAEKAPKKKRRPIKLAHKSRNPERTRENIIQAAIREFSTHGLKGGRIERIAKESDINLRMIYHYYESKEKLYISTLDRVYRDVREAESGLHIQDLPPDEAIRKLVRFTFDHFQRHPELVNLVMGENLLHAEYLKQSDLVPMMTVQLQDQVRVALKQGVEEKLFREGVEPVHLWLTIFALCWVPAANKHTMSWTLQKDLTTERWLAERRCFVEDVVMRYLMRGEAQA